LNNAIDENSIEHQILVEQVNLLHRSRVPMLVINLLVGTAFACALRGVVSDSVLNIWMSLMLTMLLVRAAFYFIYRGQFTPRLVKQYRLQLIIGAGAAGIIWGFGSLVMLPLDNLEYQLFILFVLLGLGIGSTSPLHVYLPAFFAFFPISMIPVAIKLLLSGGTIQLSLGVLTILYVIVMSLFNIKINRNLKDSLRLRFENMDLVERLREQKNDADNANRAKSKFLAAASHDLRQPLYALSLFTSALEELVHNPELLKIVNQIKTSTESMKSMFNALLNISQLDAGVTYPEKTNFLLQPFFENMANQFDILAKEKNLLIHWPSGVYAVHSDRELVEQIMRNLISNAIRYTDKGEVTISCEPDEGQIVIKVIDTGVGISADDQDVIFEEFQQIGNPERDRNKGQGLGLAIVQRTATLLEHSIALESLPGRGSTFSVRIEQANIDDCIVYMDAAPESLADQTTDLLIVVIDDDISVLEGTQTLFKSWGCGIITATDQDHALTLLRQQSRKPNGIIADYRLRNNETGINAIKAIQSEYNDRVPALIVTGEVEIDRLKELSQSGIQMLFKPVNPLKLLTFLRNVEKYKSR
jgi:signal transduction histidine kinase/ActR/RegA family two-component response regulator